MTTTLMTTMSERLRKVLACLWLLAAACDGQSTVTTPSAAADVAAAAAAGHAASASVFAAAPDRRWRLPTKLREISGIALSADGRLFAHDDERAVISQIDLASGRVVKSFGLGDPVERGDFEDIAITPQGDFYLVTSTGRLYRFREGGNGEHVNFEAIDTGLRRVCEIEGLAAAPSGDLILACKENWRRAARRVVTFYAWSPRTRALAGEPYLSVPARQFAEAARTPGFHPSAISFDTRSGRLIVLAGRENAMVELDPGGAVAAARRLGRFHQQAEGAAVTPGGGLLISDEGAGARALLTRYPRAHD